MSRKDSVERPYEASNGQGCREQIEKALFLMLKYVQPGELMWVLKSREVTERDWRDIISRAPIYPV